MNYDYFIIIIIYFYYYYYCYHRLGVSPSLLYKP